MRWVVNNAAFVHPVTVLCLLDHVHVHVTMMMMVVVKDRSKLTPWF